jgi:hypothetical protein
MSRLSKSFKCFTQVPNEILDDVRVSLKAKGLFAFFASKPDNWDFSLLGMSKQLKESKTAILNIIDELCKFGYMTKTKTRNGNFQGYNDYQLHATPYFPSESSFESHKTRVTKSESQNATTNNTKYNNTKNNNIKNREEEEAKPFFDFNSFLSYFRSNFVGIEFAIDQGTSQLKVFLNKSGFLINAESLKMVSVGSAKDIYKRLFSKWDSAKPYFYQEFARIQLQNKG